LTNKRVHNVPSSKQYWLNICPILHTILAQYCVQYRNNIGQFTFQLYLANIGGSYWANISYNIGSILCAISHQYWPVHISTIFSQYWWFILGQYKLHYWTNIATSRVPLFCQHYV